MNNHADNIIQAVETIVDQKLNNFAFDKTESCKIVSQDSDDKQKYWVSNGNMRFEAYVLNGESNYSVNSQVYVLIPKGNYSERKIILGSASDQVNVATKYTKPFENTIIANSFELLNENKLNIDNTLKSDNIIINIQDLENNTGFGVYDYIGVEFSIISNIISKADFYVKLQLLNNEGNNISEEDSLIFDSKQVCGNPYALNENFTFQHLFYFPKLKQEINTINQVKVELGWKNNDSIILSVEDIVKLNKYNIYFSYDKNNQQLSQQTIMSIQFPNTQNEDIKKTYVSPLPSTASTELQEQYEDISESYKRKTLKFDWYKNNEIINYGPRINNIDSKLSEYDIYWCQYLSKSPYTKLLDSDINEIRNCYYNIENNNQTIWISNNLTIDNNSFQSLFVKEEAKDKYNNIIDLKQNVDSIIQSNEKIQTVTGLYYLKTKDPDTAPSAPDSDEGITTIEMKSDMWTTVCPENINMDGRFYTCLQKTDISGTITYSNPISYFNNVTIKNIVISFTIELVSQSNDKTTYYSNLINNNNLKSKFINNINLLEKYKAIYNETPEVFEINLTNQFKDIVESGTYWQTIKKTNATDPNAYIYDLYLPESGSTREQNEEQVKAIIKNNTTGEWIEVSGFIFQGTKTIEDLVIDEELNQINDNIVKQVEIELGSSNSHVQEPIDWVTETPTNGSFYWFRQKITNKNDRVVYGPAMCFTDKNIDNIVSLYYLQTDGNSAPNQPSLEIEDLNNISDKWTTKCPEYISKGQFWTCLQYKVEEELIWTKPIQALITNPPKKTDIEFIGIEENKVGGSDTPAWNDSNWNTIYEKPNTEKKVYIWQRTKTIYTNDIIQYGDSINIDNQASKDGKTPITIIDLYYLDENGDMTIEELKEKLNEYPPVGGDLETGINKWTKWQPQIPPPSAKSKYWTVLYYIYDNNSSGYGEPVIDEQLTSTAAAIDATVVDVNIFFARTETDEPPEKPADGTKETKDANGKITINNIWYDNDEDIPNEDKIQKPYLWQCQQMKTKSGDTTYSAPILIKTKQMINSVELYYLWNGTGNKPTTGEAPSKPTGNNYYAFNTWYDSIPPWKTNAHSYFTCVQITYDTGEITYTTPTQSQGTPVEIDIEFAIDDNDDTTNYPDNGWSTSYPSSNENNRPIWTRQKTKYANGTLTYSGHTCINLKDIKNIVELYYLKTYRPSITPSKPTSAITTTIMGTDKWTLSIPEYVSGSKYYTCLQTEYIDGSYSWSNVTDATDKNSSIEATNKANSAADRADSAAGKAEENAEKAAQKAQDAEDAANSVVKDINAYFTVTDSSEIIPSKPADDQQPDENGQIIIIDGQKKTIWYDEPTNAMLNDYSSYLWQIYKKTTHDGTIVYTDPVLLTIPAVSYSLLSNTKVLQRTADDMPTINPSELEFICQRQIGNNDPVEFNCYWKINDEVEYDGYDGSPKHISTLKFEISPYVEYISVKAYLHAEVISEWNAKLTTLLGEVFLPVVSDGQGENGNIVSYLYFLSDRPMGASDWEKYPPKYQTDEEGRLEPSIGWQEIPHGVTEQYQYEYVSVCDKFDGVNSEFSTPSLWAKWGEQGSQGVGVEEIHEIYYLQTGDPPSLPDPEGTIGNSKGPDVWTTQMPSYVNNGAYWSCIQCIYTDGTKTYTNLTLISQGIDVETSRIEELYQFIDSEFIDELEVIIDKNNPGVYNYYELNCSLEQSKRYATYGIKAKFFDNREKTPVEGKYYKIIWEVPKSATMIKPLSNYENLELIAIEDNDDYYEYQGYLEYKNNEWKTLKNFSYQLQQLFGYNKINNTIWCKIIEYDADPRINTSSINKVFVGRLKQDLKFGFKNTAGTDWRLNIFSDKPVLLENDEITLTAVLQDPEGNTVPQEEWQNDLTWSWHSCDSYDGAQYQLRANDTVIPPFEYQQINTYSITFVSVPYNGGMYRINQINNIFYDDSNEVYYYDLNLIAPDFSEELSVYFYSDIDFREKIKQSTTVLSFEDEYITLYQEKQVSIKASEVKVTRTTSQDYYAIVKATLNNITIKDNYSVNLTAYFPVASSNKDSYYLNGPSIIVYDREGVLQNYDSGIPYQVFENGIEFNQDVMINIYEEGQEENFMFKLKDNQLYPCSVLPSNIPKAGIFCAITNNDSFDYYIQPLLIVRDIYYYKRNLINKWDGALQIDEANNAILAASFIAGRKEPNNTFTGVLLGEVGADIDQKGINGIYGVQEGKLRYKFTENGEAYIGTGSDNYIDFSNNQLSIKTNDLVLNTSNLNINTKATGTAPVLTVSGRANIGGWSIGSDIFECTRTDENGEGFRVILRTPLTKGGPGYGGVHDILVLTEYTPQTGGTIKSTYPFILTSDGGLVAEKATIKGTFSALATSQIDNTESAETYSLSIGNSITKPNPIRTSQLYQGIVVKNTNSSTRQLIIGAFKEKVDFSGTTSFEGNVIGSYDNDLLITSANTKRIYQSEPSFHQHITISSSIYTYDYVDYSYNPSAVIRLWANQRQYDYATEGSTVSTYISIDAMEVNISGNKLDIEGGTSLSLGASSVSTHGSWSGSVSTGSNSDRRLKNSIANIDEQYTTFFDHLIPVVYKYNDGTSNRFHTGFIAQDVETALTKAELTTQDFAGIILVNKGAEDEHYALRYDEFIALNTLQIQKLKTRVTELENEIKEIKQRYEI